MSWAEFILRLIAFNRTEQRNEYKLRRLAWVTFISPYQDPKKLRGMKEDTWWRIGKKQVKKVSEESKKRFFEEYQKFLDIQNGTT